MTDGATQPPVGRLYAVEGLKLSLNRTGEGSPAVVIMPGAGLIGLDYLNLQDALDGAATVVTYDRAATGWSDPVALPRSAAAVAQESRALLQAAGIAPPYLLVGHSLGGAYARRYAQLFPDEIAGLLFLDPAHEGYEIDPPRMGLVDQVRQTIRLLGAFLRFKAVYRPMFARMYAAWPAPLRRTLVDYHLRAWRKTLQETRNLQSEVMGEVRDGGALPDRPLIVLTALGLDPFMARFAPEPYLRALNDRKRQFYANFAATVPRGENRLVEDAGHSTLHIDRPDAVIQAIRDLIGGFANSSRPEV